MTQEALGRQLGVTNKTVSRWETGNYMPDIEAMQLLSGVLGVSLNELVCGARLTDADFREQADRNIVSAYKEGRFSLKESFAFWKHKWLAEHASLLFACGGAAAGLFAWAWYSRVVWLAGLCPLLGFCVYGFLRDRMMIYIEDKLYPLKRD